MFAEIVFVALVITANPPAIDGIYPNPGTDNDRGEFIILDVPENTAFSNFTITDGENTVEITGLEERGSVVITDDPGPASALTDYPIHEVDDFLFLANRGEWVSLEYGNQTIENVTYPRATEGELYRNGQFIPIGRTSFDPMLSRNVTVESVLLPDDPTLLETIESGRERIFLAGYTFTDPAIADALIAAHEHNVTVRVLVEGGPVGGISRPQVTQLDRLRNAGVTVDVMGTSLARYRYHHAKYAVVDDRAVVSSENWKPGGAGGNGSRGWATVIRDRRVATDLARIFAADTGFLDTDSWDDTRPAEPVPAQPDTATYPTRFETQVSEAESVTVLVAPDTAATGVTRLLENANDSIRIQQVSIDGSGSLMNATLAAAERGVNVRILLSGAWYAESENRALAERLRYRVEHEQLPLEVKIAEPRSRYEKIHTKGVIVDGESVLVGSLNWNSNALYENREVAVRIDDRETAAYFKRAFLADWRGAAWRVSWETLLGLVGVLIGGLWYAGRIATFE